MGSYGISFSFCPHAQPPPLSRKSQFWCLWFLWVHWCTADKYNCIAYMVDIWLFVYFCYVMLYFTVKLQDLWSPYFLLKKWGKPAQCISGSLEHSSIYCLKLTFLSTIFLIYVLISIVIWDIKGLNYNWGELYISADINLLRTYFLMIVLSCIKTHVSLTFCIKKYIYINIYIYVNCRPCVKTVF